MINSQGTGKKFRVVQFIARPFEGIDDYVCVPDNWVVIQRHHDRKVVVSYPKDEEKSVTRERVKREEQYDDDWKFWTAEQKYQADTFEEADLWIITGRNYVPLPSQNLSVNATQLTSALNKELRSNKRKSTSGSKEDRPEMTAKPHKIPRKPLPRVIIKIPTYDDVEPECKTKRGRKPATKAVESTDAGARNANAEPECSSRSASYENEPEITNIMDEGYHSQQDQQPTENDDNRQNNLIVDMPAAQNHSQSNRNALPNFQPQISNVQSLATTTNNEKSRTNDSASNGPSISQERPESPSISAQIRQMMKGKPILKAKYLNIEEKKRPENVRDCIIARQLASSNLYQRSSHQRPTIGPTAIGGWRIQPGDIPVNFQYIRSPPTPAPQESSSLLFLNLPNYVQRTLLATRGNILSDEERTRGNQGQGVRVNRPAPVQMTCYKNSDMKSQEIHPTYKKKRFFFNQSPSAANSGIELDDEALREIEAEDALLPPPKIVTHYLDDDLVFVPEEQMMDHGAPATDQMSSTLNSMINVFEKLQTAVLKATADCHMLLENMQRINSSENSASQASTSRDTALFVSASSNGCQDRVNMEVVPEVNRNPPLQIILPPEFDPADTAWTLKHEDDEPGLLELVPYSRIYIKFGELKYWEQVSEDCPTLARRILGELFKRNALSVCASMTEKEPNGRPKLNEHACAILIDYVIGQGVKRRWNTDMQPILEALDDEVKKIRSKFGGRFTRQVV